MMASAVDTMEPWRTYDTGSASMKKPNARMKMHNFKIAGIALLTPL
jgi:hypothetical protein